jgi:DNA-binding MarR family transcriptional regulator
VEVSPGDIAAEWPLTALLRGARAAFRAAIRENLADHGYDDLPANGPYVIGAIARTTAPLSEVVRQLGVSKQAAGQLVDTLVIRGYLDRSVDPADRRRLVVRLTERGREAAVIIRAASDSLEAEMTSTFGAEAVRITRGVLAGLARRPADG